MTSKTCVSDCCKCYRENACTYASSASRNVIVKHSFCGERAKRSPCVGHTNGSKSRGSPSRARRRVRACHRSGSSTCCVTLPATMPSVPRVVRAEPLCNLRTTLHTCALLEPVRCCGGRRRTAAPGINACRALVAKHTKNATKHTKNAKYAHKINHYTKIAKKFTNNANIANKCTPKIDAPCAACRARRPGVTPWMRVQMREKLGRARSTRVVQQR
jgi:hypothetical protein